MTGKITTVIIFLFIVLTNQLIAKEYTVNSAEELSALSFLPGDKVILRKGNWVNQKLLFKGDGTKEKPILLTAEKQGETILTGSSSLTINGKWLIVDGLSFKDGYTLKENVISFSEASLNCRLTNTSIVDYNNPDKGVRNSWIVLYGQYNRIDHCYIKGKTHVGTTIGIYVSDKPNYHRIDHNYFAERPPLGSNGGEIIRMGTDQWSLHDSYSVVEENIFEHCDGEIEIVSNKSTHNTIRNNLFYESRGMLTLRHGNYANVYGNYFIGNGKEGTGGIRITGENHKIHNNYLHGLTGKGLNAAITFMNAWENPPLHGYSQIKNAQVVGNTVIDCTESIVIGSGKNEQTFLPPVNSVIANNIIVTKMPLIVWTEATAKHPDNIRFDNNLAFGMPAKDSLPDGIAVRDPLLKPDAIGIYKPDKISPARNNFSGDFPFKPSNDIGATSLNNLQMAVLSAENIGPSWMKLVKKFEIKKH